MEKTPRIFLKQLTKNYAEINHRQKVYQNFRLGIVHYGRILVRCILENPRISLTIWDTTESPTPIKKIAGGGNLADTK
jgi:hypothetical protein